MEDTQKTVTSLVTGWVPTGEQKSDDVPSSSQLNIVVFRITSYRGFGSRHNIASIFSSRRSFIERSGFSSKQWLLVVFEMVLSFCWWVIRTRRRDVNDLNARNLTERQELIDQYLRRGWGSFLSLLVGYIADTYFNMYAMAIFNVVLHFLLCTVLFMELTIRFGDYDLYSGFFYQSVGILLIPLKATDFARTVYALQILGKKNLKIALIFIFYTAWFSDRALGGIMVFLVSINNVTWTSKVRLSFLASLIAMGFYIYLFKPPGDRFVLSQGQVGNDFIGCIVTALWTRHRLKDRLTEKLDWLDYAEIKYDKFLINRARDLVKLYCLIGSTVGFSLYAVPRCDFYEVVWEHLIPTGLFKKTGIEAGVSLVTIITMGATQLIVMPLLRRTRFSRSFMQRYVVGYLFALFCMLYTTVLLQSVTKYLPTPGVGVVRILNVRDDSVSLKSDQPDITPFEHLVKPKSDVLIYLDVSEEKLTRVHFGFNEYNFTSHISSRPGSMIGYVLFEPANLQRMGDELPIRELRAGKNNPKMPKIYVFNTMEMNVTVEFRNANLGVYAFTVSAGKLVFDQVPEGRYELRTLEFESNGAQAIEMTAGGFYGIVSHESSLETLMTADTLLTRKAIDSEYILGTQIPYAIAITLSYVTLRGMVFCNTPDGMEGLSFGFLEFVDNATFYLLWIGYQSWHPFITSFSFSIYTIIELFMMFISSSLFIKYHNWYKFQL